MTPFGVVALFAIGLVVIVVLYLVVAVYNDVVALRNRIDKAWANIEVVLQQRHDQLPNLLNAVRGVMAFEQEVLTRVTEARARYSPSAPVAEQAATSEATSSAVRQLFAVVERYPEVRSATNVLELQEEIERLESMIADRRELYNDQVFRYDTRIQQVPATVLASVFGWTARPFFDAEDAADVRPEVSLERR